MSIRISSKEQEKLVLENLRLVNHIVNKFKVAPSDYEDFVSVGTIGLVKAAVTFNKEKSIKFSTYAGSCIQNEILMHIRREKKHSNIVSLDDIINTDKDGNEITIGEIIKSSDKDFREEIAENDTLEKIVSIILNIPNTRKKLIMLYKIAGVSQPKIAEILNISQSYVSRLKDKLKEEIMEYFTTSQQIKEDFKMAIVGNSYRISFSSKNVMQFNKIFATLLQKLTSAETLPDFKVVCNNERIIIQVPAHPESFSFIAQIIQEIDDYSFTFASNKEALSADNVVSDRIKSDKNVSTMEEEKAGLNVEEDETLQPAQDKGEADVSECELSEEIVSIEKMQIISDNLSTSIEVDKSPLTKENSTVKRGTQLNQVREYILSRETFTTKELRQQFPGVPISTINNALTLAKNKGLITSVSKGQYATKKG